MGISGDSGLHSPECSGKPTVKKDRFSWTKRATKGSSFWDVENQLFERGLEVESWKWLRKEIKKGCERNVCRNLILYS